MSQDKDPAEDSANDFYLTMITILQSQQKAIAQMSAAVSALIQIIVEKHPDVAEKYEQYRAAAETSSPLSVASQNFARTLDEIMKRYRGV